ncbi:hypothetical protein TNCV_2574851 [Trichonephila clavipes]|nr:hypothetical protein TNCV_2574851 [Trichonephila clavipes]
MKRVIMHHIFKPWKESWSQQLDNKLHSVKPVLVSLLYLFNRIWREQVYPNQWQEAIVIPILNPSGGSPSLVRWGLGGSGHVEGTGEKLSFASQAAR